MSIVPSAAAVRPNRSRLLSLALSASLVLTSCSLPAFAQATQPTAAAGIQHLYINILEGEGALNNIRQRDAREPVIQVTDENHKPVAGVALLLLIHGGDSGGTATFSNGATSLGTSTDSQGIAHVTGLHVGQQPGSFTITVAATLGALAATAIIHQSNIIGPLSTATESSASSAGGAGGGAGSAAVHHGIFHLGKTALVTAGVVVVAAVVVSVVVATKSDDSTTLSLGGSTVGAPR